MTKYYLNEHIQKKLCLKVFDFNGTDYYHIGVSNNDSIKVDEFSYRDLMRYVFSLEEQAIMENQIIARPSYIQKCGLPCFTDPDDAEYIYDYLESLIVMKKLSGGEIKDPNNGGL